jgi:hypothetical protein
MSGSSTSINTAVASADAPAALAHTSGSTTTINTPTRRRGIADNRTEARMGPSRNCCIATCDIDASLADERPPSPPRITWVATTAPIHVVLAELIGLWIP